MSDPAGAFTYRAVLRTPGVLRVFPAATVGRLSYAAVPLALLLTVQEATSSYTAAGTSLGLYGLASLVMPIKARLVDRFGQKRVLPVLSAALAAVLCAMGLAYSLGTRAAVPFLLLAVLAGVSAPPLGPAMRTLWAAVTPEPGARQRAYSLDSVVEEALYAVGPLAVGLVTAIATPAVALAGAAVLNLAGTTIMATSSISLEHGRSTSRQHSRTWLGPFRSRTFLVLALAMVGVGLGTGPLEVAVAARTEQTGQPGVAGVLFALLAVGSVVGGLIWGRIHHRRALPTRLGVLAVATAAGLIATSLATPVPLLAIALFATGAVSAPIYTVAYVTSDELAPVDARTEASTWINTSSNLGIGAGSSAAGLLLDQTDPAGTLAAAALPVLVAAVIAFTVLRLPISTPRASGPA